MENPPASAPSSPRRLWWLLAAFVACYFAMFAFFPRLFFFFGVNSYGVWFLDSYAILASNDAVNIGRDAYIYNPLDPFGRGNSYTHWWLHLRDLGLTRAHNFQVGLAFVLAFFAAALARLRPRAPGELLWYLVVLCSSPILLAVERANNDLVIFALLAPVVPCLLAPQRAWRWLAIPLIALAAGLKFYPAVAGLVLLAGTETREVRARVLGGLLALAAVGVNMAHEPLMRAANPPKAEGLMTLGAVNVFEGAQHFAWGAAVAWLSLATFVVVVIYGVRAFNGWALRPHERDVWLSFVLGAVLLAGCFFTARNFSYRWVYAVWLAPLLWQLPRDPLTPVRVRRFATLTAVLLIAALWIDPIASSCFGQIREKFSNTTLLRWGDQIFLCEQPITWAFFGCLVAFLAHFTRRGLRVLFARE